MDVDDKFFIARWLFLCLGVAAVVLPLPEPIGKLAVVLWLVAFGLWVTWLASDGLRWAASALRRIWRRER